MNALRCFRLLTVVTAIAVAVLSTAPPASGQSVLQNLSPSPVTAAIDYSVAQHYGLVQQTALQPPAGDDGNEDSLQPRPPQPRITPPRRTPPTTNTTWRSSSLSRRRVTRLASIPKMFGDWGPMNGHMQVQNSNMPGYEFAAQTASAGVGQRMKVLENNNAWPDDRVDFLYNHFHNSVSSNPSLATNNSNQFPTDRYTFSYERTFFDGLTSLQLLLPFAGTPTLTSTGPGFPNNFVDGGNVGNVGLVFKALVFENGNLAFAGGMGLNLPTGSDANGRAFNSTFHIENQSFQIAPFVAFIWSPADPFLSNFFVQGGIQFDFVTNGNTVSAANPMAGYYGDLAEVVDPNILFSDLVLGVWLYENPGGAILTGMTGQVEIHYATSTRARTAVGYAGNDMFIFGGGGSRVDSLNLTGGLRFMLFGNTVISVSGVAPLHRRLFDAEVQAVASIFL